MATATVIVSRKWGGLLDRAQTWQIVIDGSAAGSIAARQTVEWPVDPGLHTLRLRWSRRFTSPERSFEVADSEAVRFACHVQRYWPLLLMALVKPDRWISLRRE